MRLALGRFARARGGIAAIEFAILLPLVVLVFFGLFELSNAMACRERVESLASTTSDLVAQSTQMTNADIANVFSAAAAVIYPYPANERVVLTSLTYVDDTTGQVAWSDASSGSARTVGAHVTVPSGVIVSGGSVILSEVTYNYSSPTKYVIPATITMSGQFYSRPRRSTSVARVP